MPPLAPHWRGLSGPVPRRSPPVDRGVQRTSIRSELPVPYPQRVLCDPDHKGPGKRLRDYPSSILKQRRSGPETPHVRSSIALPPSRPADSSVGPLRSPRAPWRQRPPVDGLSARSPRKPEGSLAPLTGPFQVESVRVSLEKNENSLNTRSNKGVRLQNH